MTLIDWLALVHPVLIILFVYPVVGATIRLGLLARERRLGQSKQPVAVPKEHADHGRWLTAGVVVAVLIALLFSFLNRWFDPAAAFPGGAGRLLLLLLVALGCVLAQQRYSSQRGESAVRSGRSGFAMAASVQLVWHY